MGRFIILPALVGMLAFFNTAGAAENSDVSAVRVSGYIIQEYRVDDNGAANPLIDGYKTLAVVNVRKNITGSFRLYARASFENVSSPEAKRAFADFAGGSNNGSVDSFGFEYENAGFKYTVGLQTFVLGPTALLYDGSFAVGRHSMPLVANISGKIGAADLTAIVGRTNYYTGSNDKLHALQGSYALDGGKSSLGFVWAGVDYGAGGGYHNYAAVSLTRRPSPKLTMTAEFLRSDFRQDNSAYTAVIDYSMDEKNSLLLADWRVELNASILDRRFWYMTTYLGDAAGQMLVWQHRINKDFSFALVDMYFSDLHDNGVKGRRNSFRAKAILAF